MLIIGRISGLSIFSFMVKLISSFWLRLSFSLLCLVNLLFLCDLFYICYLVCGDFGNFHGR